MKWRPSGWLEAASRRGIGFTPLSALYRQSPPRHDTIFGYAASDEAQIRNGLRQIRTAC